MKEEPRWVGAALGAVRDADVLLEELRSQGASLPKLDAPAAEALLARLSSVRKAANERLLTILDSDPLPGPTERSHRCRQRSTARRPRRRA